MLKDVVHHFCWFIQLELIARLLMA